jgi:hypothetical protein
MIRMRYDVRPYHVAKRIGHFPVRKPIGGGTMTLISNADFKVVWEQPTNPEDLNAIFIHVNPAESSFKHLFQMLQDLALPLVDNYLSIGHTLSLPERILVENLGFKRTTGNYWTWLGSQEAHTEP